VANFPLTYQTVKLWRLSIFVLFHVLYFYLSDSLQKKSKVRRDHHLSGTSGKDRITWYQVYLNEIYCLLGLLYHPLSNDLLFDGWTYGATYYQTIH